MGVPTLYRGPSSGTTDRLGSVKQRLLKNVNELRHLLHTDWNNAADALVRHAEAINAATRRIHYAEDFGIYPGTNEDISDLVQAAIDTLEAGDVLQFDSGVHLISHIELNAHLNPSLRGVIIRGKFGRTIFQNRGTDATVPMVSVASDTCVFEDFIFRGGHNHTRRCLTLVDVGPISEEHSGNGINFNRFSRCFFDAYLQPATWTDPDTEEVVDLWGSKALFTISGHRSFVLGLGNGFNCESTLFYDCYWSVRNTESLSRADICVRVGYSSQPYATIFLGDCRMYGGYQPFGVGVSVENNYACSLLFSGGTEFQQLENCVRVTGQATNVYLAGTQFEACKRIGTFSGAGSATITLDGGRANSEQLTQASLGPTGYAASDNRLISVEGRQTLVVRSLDFEGTGQEIPRARIYLGTQASLDLSGGAWPAREVLQRASGEPDPEAYARICTRYYGQSDGYGRMHEPDVFAENAEGTAGIYGTQTSVVVPLPRTESGEHYAVDVAIVEVAGEPAAGATRIRGMPVDADHVRFDADAAPGAGAGVRFAYRTRRAAPLIVTEPADMPAPLALLLDGSGMNATGGILDDWTDTTDSRQFLPTGDLVHTAEDADFGGLPSITLADENDLLTSVEAASAWAFASNGGDGFFIWWVLHTGGDADAAVYTSQAADGAGFYLRSMQRGQLRMSRSGGLSGYTFAGSGPTTRRYIAGGFEGGAGVGANHASPALRLRVSGESTRGEYLSNAGSFDGETPDNTLTIRGASQGPVKIAELGIYGRGLSPYEHEAHVAYLERKYKGF